MSGTNLHAAQAAGAIAPANISWASLQQDGAITATPIKHLVVIFAESASFDHYFATYPAAINTVGEPIFTAAPSTPPVDNLATSGLLMNNGNFTNQDNAENAAEPFRFDRGQDNVSVQNGGYTVTQLAQDHGRADLFPEYTGRGTPGGAGAFGTKGQVMGYYDGNTVTALWQYAQHFALNDNAYTDTYGASTSGALNVVSGQTNGVKIVVAKPGGVPFAVSDGQGGYTLINDADPGYDVCSNPATQVVMTGKNIGDLLNVSAITWGGFMGGFALGETNPNGTTGCARSTASPTVGQAVTDYIAHHNWFQYFATTANPRHLRPASLAAVGYSYDHSGAADPANHQYDLGDFYAALSAGDFPSVSFIQLPAYQDGHAGYSDPLDEQAGLVALINFLQRLPQWRSTAVIITWDGADGWYDHAFAAPSSSSADPLADQLTAPGQCGTGTPRAGVSGNPVNGRCGPGTRVPFLLISPWAKPNYVDSNRITQASVVRFVEDNWLNGRRLGGGAFDASAGSITQMFSFGGTGAAPKLILDENTGEVATPTAH